MSLFPQIELELWSKRYQIRLNPVPCPDCKHLLELVKPVAIKGYRGLQAETCKNCELDSGIVRFVPVDRDKIELWESIKP